MMDQLQIEAALLSISSSGVHFGNDQKAEELFRRVNEEGTRLRLDNTRLVQLLGERRGSRAGSYGRPGAPSPKVRPGGCAPARQLNTWE